MALTVLCVLRSGGVYTPDWVLRLRAGVARHLPAPHRFVCLSDVAVPGVETIPLAHDWPRWWAKVEMWRPDLEDLGRVLYIDLDTVATGDLSGFAAYDGPAAITEDFYCGGPSQSVLSYAPGAFRHLWDAFTSCPSAWMEDGDRMKAPHFGDQVLMTKGHLPRPIDYWQRLLPGHLVSYKVHCRQALPEGARLVCFHGRPKPNAFTGDHWVAQQWSRA